jgi:membrane protease YdiL (CAAX protease family)
MKESARFLRSWQVPNSPETSALVFFIFWAAPFILGVSLGLYWFVTKQPLLPPQRHRLVAWGAPEVCLAVLIILLLPTVFAILLQQVDYFGLIDNPPLAAKAVADKLTPTERISLQRQGLLAQALATPFEVILILWLFRKLSNTQPYQLGLTRHRLGSNAAAGALLWFLVTPLVYFISFLVAIVFQMLVKGEEEKHPLEKLIVTQGDPLDWALLIFLAVLAAPLIEELVFRGMLQRWFARRPWGGDAAMAAAFLLALLGRSKPLTRGIINGDLSVVLYELGPALFVLAMVPGLLWVDRLAWRWFPTPQRRQPFASSELPWPNNGAVSGGPRGLRPHAPQDGLLTRLMDRYVARVTQPPGLNSAYIARAWYGTAVLFAAVHAGVWPSPIPLVALAFALGWLAYRTQSLIGSMVFHSLFNAVTCFSLIMNSLS